MKRFAKPFGIMFGLAILGLVVTVIPHKDANAQSPQPVTVVNQPSVTVRNSPLTVAVRGITVGAPVPVQGTVSANINGTPAVTLSGTPSVNFSNTSTTPLFVRDVDNPVNEPFAASLCQGSGTSGSNQPQPCYFGGNGPGSFVVPTTTSDGKTVKELVIKFVDGECYVINPDPRSGITDVNLSTTVTQNQVTFPQFQGYVTHFFPFSSNPSLNNNSTLEFATPTEIMANPNTSVDFSVDSIITTQFGCTLGLSGYLVTQ